ncbi:hypothetical protein BH24CHL9_BH24CHL9_05120 [soil metagenome]
MVADEVTLATWLRVWKLPRRETNQWYAAGVITDSDYPAACRFGMLIDRHGHVCAYGGEGGLFDHARLLVSEARLAGRLGTWAHVACTFGPRGTAIWIDGQLDSSQPGPAVTGCLTAGPAARGRIGAVAEDGRADGHLDADISRPFAAARSLSGDELGAVVAARGHQPASDLVSGPFLGEWHLAEESGDRAADASASGRDAVIVNGGTWEIGGPAFDASRRTTDYEPRRDSQRGHGLRFSSDDLLDAGWPALLRYDVPADAESGLYAARVRLAGTSWSDGLAIPFVVVRTTPAVRGAVALLVPTNTWHAYGRRFDDLPVPAGLHSSFYTAHESGRPFFELGTRLPIPRADPYGSDSERAARQGHAQLVRPERIAEAWLRREGYAVECVTDLELHRGEVTLETFGCLLLAGHSEYWSSEMRDRVEAYLERGGRLLSLSGDTASQRVVISRENTAIEARKITDSDPLWLTPDRQGERWHPGEQGPGGRFRSLGRPPWTMLGVSTKGMIDDGTPTAFAPLTVLERDPFLFQAPEVVPVAEDGTIGSTSVNGPAISGYEFDASPDVLGFRDAPLPGVTVLARAMGQANLEAIGGADVGADTIYWERPAGGQVFSLSSIGASGALVDDGVAALVRNVLHHFGVSRVGSA